VTEDREALREASAAVRQEITDLLHEEREAARREGSRINRAASVVAWAGLGVAASGLALPLILSGSPAARTSVAFAAAAVGFSAVYFALNVILGRGRRPERNALTLQLHLVDAVDRAAGDERAPRSPARQ
jgi:hypothetical protein